MEKIGLWVFGYGSLLWRPDFLFSHVETASIAGWERRFWQGSPDHRGTPAFPGRVVTLVPSPAALCTGRLYGVQQADVQRVSEYLDFRESGGYSRLWVTVNSASGERFRALTYVALAGNSHYLGPANDVAMEAHIRTASGPSGTNLDYFRRLEGALTALNVPEQELQTVSAGGLTEA